MIFTSFIYFLAILISVHSLDFSDNALHNNNNISLLHSTSPSSIIKANDIPSDLPLLIWLFWEGTIPSEVRYILHHNKEIMNNYNIIYLSSLSIYNYIDINTLPSKFHSLPLPNQSDYFKVNILYKYGGIFMDCSTFIREEETLNRIMKEAEEKKADIAAFNSFHPPSYHIELGFLVGRRHCTLLEKIKREVDICLSIGRRKYMKRRMKEGVVVKEKVVGFSDSSTKSVIVNEYFYCYLCFQYVIQKVYHNNINAVLYKAEDSFYYLQHKCLWDGECIKKEIENNSSIMHLPIIKFTAHSRGKIPFPYIEIM